MYRSSRVDLEVLGKIPGVKAAWGGVRQHPDRTTIPGILVLRVNVSLFWVNATKVQEAILQAVDAAPDTVALILNLEATDQLETTSADMLSELREQLAERNVDMYFVRVRWRVRTVLAHTGLRARLGEDHLWHNVAQGIREARRQHGIEPPGQPEPEPVLEEAEYPCRIRTGGCGQLSHRCSFEGSVSQQGRRLARWSRQRPVALARALLAVARCKRQRAVVLRPAGSKRRLSPDFQAGEVSL